MRNVLVIAYYWPPAGGPGVQRWLKFVKYLGEHNCAVTVYIPENPSYPLVDNSMQSEIPKNVTILKQPIKEPYRIAGWFGKKQTKKLSAGVIPIQKQSFITKFLLWVRGNVFIPDARIFWVKPSVRFLQDYCKHNKMDTIITTGPPHSVHLIGARLQKLTGKRWLADFRDPWTTIGYHTQLKLTTFAQKKHKALERMVLQQANAIIVTSPATKKEFSKLTTKPIQVITNGFDTEIAKDVVLDEYFTISHIGSLLSGRNPELFWQAISELRTENEAFNVKCKLQFIGAVSDDVLARIAAYNLQDITYSLGYIAHHDAVRYQQKSQVLLLLEIDRPETRGIIAGKLFEYMAASRPIIAIGPSQWDVAKIIAETNSGHSFTYQEKDALKALLLTCFERYQQQNLNVHSYGVEKYSRKALTKQLAKLV